MLTIPFIDKTKAAFLVLGALPPMPMIRAQVIPRMMGLLEHAEPELRLEILKVLDHFAQTDELEMFQQVHHWTLKTINEDNPPASLEATCTILRNLSSGLSSG